MSETGLRGGCRNGYVGRHEVTNAVRGARKRDHYAVSACVHRGAHSGLQLAGINRQGTNGFARYGEDRIGHRWRHTNRWRLAEPTKHPGALDVRFEHRDFVHSHAPVVVEIAPLHAFAIERNRAVPRSRGAEGRRSALNLGGDRIRIDRYAVRRPANLEGESHRRLLPRYLRRRKDARFVSWLSNALLRCYTCPTRI
jgi:hypothetical protein